MQFDYFIVGQGIAGTVLADTLINAGKLVLVINNENLQSSSEVAAGIYNPVTGQRLVKTWQADLLFPFLEKYYEKMQEKSGVKFFQKCPLYRPFDSIAEQNAWIARTAHADLKPYIRNAEKNIVPQNLIHDELGGIETLNSGWVDVKTMINAFRLFLKEKGLYINSEFHYKDFILENNMVFWRESRAEKIIFCEGIHAMQNPFFNYLPFKPVKGEILTIEIPEIDLPSIVNQGVYIFQLGDKKFKLGATYDWNANDWKITDEGKKELTLKFDKMIKKTYAITNHEAGIRPATPDRRPFIGLHPEFQQLGIFNGLGAKGISLAPYFASEFANYLETGKELDKEVQVERYYSLYSSAKTNRNL